MLDEVQYFRIGTRYGLEILHQCDKRFKNKSRKVLVPNSTFEKVIGKIQSASTYSAYGPKNKKEDKNYKKTWNLWYIYQKELNKALLSTWHCLWRF